MIAADLNKYDTPLAELDKKHIDLEKENKTQNFSDVNNIQDMKEKFGVKYY